MPTRLLYVDVTRLAIAQQSGEDLLGDRSTWWAESIVTIEVHVDAEGFIRRFEWAHDDGFLGPAWRRVDYFDFDADITIETPSDWIEISEDLAALVGPCCE